MAQKTVIAPAIAQLRYCLVAILAIALAMHFLALPKITDVKRESAGSKPEAHMLLPANINIHNNHLHEQTYSLTINYKAGQQTQFHVHAENCIKHISLNNFPISFPLGDACNFINGFELELSHQLVEGENTLRIETSAPGIAIGPVIFGEAPGLTDILACLLVGVFCIALVRAMELLTGEVLTGIILSGAFILYLGVLSHTTFMQRKYDMPQHLEYITFIAKNLRWPNTYEGFLTYHPPLYYTSQAIVLRIANAMGSFDVIETLRLFNVFYFMGAMVFSALALRLLIRNPVAYYATLIMTVTYPGCWISAVRMDSNLLFYTFFSGTLYFLLRWMQAGAKKDMAWALSMCGLALATRTNALVLVPMFGLAALYHWYKDGFTSLWRHLYNKRVWLGLLVLAIGALMNFGRPMYDNIFHHRDQTFLVANAEFLAQIATGLRVTNEWASYLGFSMDSYLHPPFYSVWSASSGRYYFWSSVLKSSLYGEFTVGRNWIAYYLNIMLLAFVLYIIISVITERKNLRRQPEWLMLFFALFIPLMGLAANRLLHPIACSQDFRYMQSAIAVFCGMIGFSIQQHLRAGRKRTAWVGIGGMAYFCYLSLMLFLNS